jgi:2-polyprenyl-3-methyl-5-hydroxy-6-metoxy-1,4-benzoquinol methylase
MADQAAEGLLSPFLRRRRLRVARPWLQGRVLDVGCGSGALAAELPPPRYLGVEIDPLSLQLARERYPGHRFAGELPPAGETFDTILSLAVIEHVPDPAGFLGALAGRLAAPHWARIVISTPHPAADWIHHTGAAIGLFSRHASEEHEQLLDRRALERLGAQAGLRMVSYRRFLLGANQLAVFASA